MRFTMVHYNEKNAEIESFSISSVLLMLSSFFCSELYWTMFDLFFFFIYLFRAEASIIRLDELNPYVTVTSSKKDLSENTDLSFLLDYSCVITTEAPLRIQLKVNEYCRTQQPPIKVNTKEHYVICWAFICFSLFHV